MIAEKYSEIKVTMDIGEAEEVIEQLDEMISLLSKSDIVFDMEEFQSLLTLKNILAMNLHD